VAVVVRHHLLNHIAGKDLFTVDDAGDFDDLRGLTLQLGFKGNPFRTAGQIA
jgi:hypothetical protein